MPVVSYIMFLLFFVLFLSLFRKGADIFSPARLFILVWSLSIGLADLKLSYHQPEWSAYSWFVLFISITSVLLGMFVVYVVNYNKPIASISLIRERIKHISFDKRLFYKLIIAVFLIYIVSYLVIYMIVGFIPLFTSLPNETRTRWSIFGFGLLIHLAPTILYVIVIYFLTFRGITSKKISLFIIALITFISFLFLLQRFDLVISIILSMVFLYYGTQKFKPKNIFIISFFLILFMYSISTLRVSELFMAYLYYTAKMKFSIDYAFLTEPYMYIVMNLENYASAANNLQHFSYGYYTFDFLLALSGLKHWIKEYVLLQDFPNIITPDFNTYSMFFTYYRDFGLIGVFVFPFLFGGIVSSIYFKMRMNPNLNTISFYGMFIFVIVFSFFIPMLSWLHFLLNITFIYFLTKMLTNRRNVKSIN